MGRLWTGWDESRFGIPLGTCKSRLRRARADLTLRIDALPESVRALVRS